MSHRGASSTVSVVLLTAIVIILFAVTSVFVLGSMESLKDDTPLVDMQSETENGNITVYHFGGDKIDSDNIIIRGGSVQEKPSEFSAGDSIIVNPTTDEGEISVIWVSDDRGHSVILASFPYVIEENNSNNDDNDDSQNTLTISNFDVQRNGGNSVISTFNSDKPLSQIKVDVSGPLTRTLDTSEFNEVQQADGSYEYRYTGILNVDGQYTFTLTKAVNNSQNGANSNSDSVLIDTTAPSVSSFNVSNPTGQEIKISFDSSEELSKLNVSLSGVSTNFDLSQFTQTENSDGNYSYQVTTNVPTDGEYTATIIDAEDDYGNDGSSGQSDNTYVDTKAPNISSFEISNPQGQEISVSFNSNEVLSAIETTVTGPETSTITETQFTQTQNSDGNYTYKSTYVAENDGSYTIELNKAEDSHGNDGADDQSMSVEVDTTDPVINNFEVSNPSGQDIKIQFDSNEDIDEIIVDLSGAESSVLDESDFSKNGNTYSSTYTGSSDGTYNAVLNKAEDSHGNDGSNGQSMSVEVDTTAPLIDDFNVTNPENQDIRIEFESNELISEIDLQISGAESDLITEDEFSRYGDTYTYTYNGSTDGNYTATLNRAEDSHGNDGAFGQSDSVRVSTSKLDIDGGLVFSNQDDQELSIINVQNGSITQLEPSNVRAISNVADLNGDASSELAYVDDNGNLNITDGRGNLKTLVNNSHTNNPYYKKTTLWIGDWNGSSTSVFYANKDNNAIYSVDENRNISRIASAENGVQAISGSGDIDGDDRKELIFLDGSQQLRYLNQDGSIDKVQNGGAGSNNGVGLGKPVDINNNSVVRIPIVDGSNKIKLIGSSERTEPITIYKNVAKSTITATDIDTDGNTEILFIGTDGSVRYIDNISGKRSIKVLNNKNGDRIEVDSNVGLSS
jgi:hypothetical protein